MAENRINQTQLAKRAGVTRQAITDAINKGKLIKNGVGRAAWIDLDDPLTVAYLKGEKPQRSASQPAAQKKPPATKAAPKKSVPPGTDPAPPPDHEEKSPPAPASNQDRVDDYMDNQRLKRLKLEQEHEKLKLNNREKRGELIKREVVKRYIHREDEIDNAQWGTLDLKISSKLAADMEIEDEKAIRRIADTVKREVVAVLKQVRRERNAFLKKMGAEKLAPVGRVA